MSCKITNHAKDIILEEKEKIFSNEFIYYLRQIYLS
jgi:hypothetical protein